MIALVLWLLFHRPVYSSNVTVNRVQFYDPATDPCLGLEGLEWRRCQPREVNLGAWDVRPAPKDWPSNKELDPPKSWPEYATEER